MFNPHVDVTQYNDAELEQKVIELGRKYWMSNNPDVQSQISATINMFKQELASRRAIAAQKSQENGNNDLDNLININ